MTPGTIAYVSREDSVAPAFTTCLARLAQYHPDCKIDHAIGNDVAKGRNRLVSEMEGSWIWFIDSDQVFDKFTLERLLTHNVPIVQAFCLMRHPPHEPVLYRRHPLHRDQDPEISPRLVEVKCLGAGGTLYWRTVFDCIPAPWFQGPTGQEDTAFAEKAVAAGFKLWVDLSTPIGHLTPIAVWPEWNGKEWLVRYTAMNGRSSYPMERI